MQRVDCEKFEVPSDFDAKREGVRYPQVQTIEYNSTTTGTVRKASVILPVDYNEEKQYPVLYLLHGIGGDHVEWCQGNPEIVIQNLIEDGETSEMIIVMPNVRARANDAAEDSLTLEHFSAFNNFINDLRDDLMPYIAANYSVKTGRENTAIAGLSMGGRTTLYIGITMVNTFGYIAAFSPAIGVLPYSANVTEDGLFTKKTLKLPDEYNTGNTLLMICNGTEDFIVNHWPATYSATLTMNDCDHIYYEVQGGGHDFGVWKNGLYNFARRLFN